MPAQETVTSELIGTIEVLSRGYSAHAIHGQPGVFKSESLYHMLMVCPHASMLNARERLKADVKNLCQMDSGPPYLQNHPSLVNQRCER